MLMYQYSETEHHLRVGKYWWGNKNKTVTTYVKSIGITGDISVYKTTNSPAQNVSVVVFATKSITLDPATTITFNWDGTAKSINYVDVSSNVNWTSEYNEDWYSTDPESATIGITRVTINCSINYDTVEREANIYFTKGANILATKSIYQDPYPA